MNKKVILVFLFAFLIRLIALDQSLWLDEATTAKVIQNYNYSEIITKFSPLDFHPPLYYLFMKFWTNIFGYSEISLRIPSVLFSLMTGYVVYLIGGIWSAIFFLFNPLIVYYSQEARMYLMATFFLTVALYFFISNIKNQKSKIHIKNQIFFLLFCTLALLTFYGSVFLIAAFLLCFLYKRQYKNLFICLFVVFVDFLLVSPLLHQQLINAKISMTNVTNWSYVLGKANVKNLLLIPIKFSIGRIDFYPKWIYYFISGLWSLFVFSILFNNLKLKIEDSLKIENFKLKILLLYLFTFPLILGFIISFFTPLLQYFRFIYLIPIMAILLSFSLSDKADRQPPRLRRQGLAIAMGFLVFSLVYLLFPQFHREDWKSLVKSLPSDKSVYMILSSSDPVKYYHPNLLIKELRIADYELKDKKILVIPYTADIHGLDYQKLLQEKKFSLTNKKSFRGLILEEYSRQ